MNVPTAVSVNALVFSGGEVWGQDEPDVGEDVDLHAVQGPSSGKAGESSQSDHGEDHNVSTYVRVFEDMIGTVIKEETHLFNDKEFAFLTVFAHVSYGARFLMVKLLLRKQGAWHRLDSLKYEGELGSVPAIANAIDELCRLLPETSDAVKKEEPEQQGDLAINKSVANLQQGQDKPALVDIGACESSLWDGPLALARSEQEMDLKSLLECLRVDELKSIAKQLKLKTNQKKDDIIRDLLNTSSSQTTLTNFTCKASTTLSKGHDQPQTKSSSGRLRPQHDRLREMVLLYIGKCVRVDEEFFRVVHRVKIVYFRITQYTPDIPVAALLTRFGKRAYPGYDYERTKNVWPTRQALLDFEEVLTLEGEVDSLLSGNVPSLGGRAIGTKTPVARFLPTPVTPGSVNGNRDGEATGDEDRKPDIKSDTNRVRGARMVKDIFERLYPRWGDLAKTNGREEGRAFGLERFHHGHVLTRIVCKGSTALGTLGEHERELEVLEALLAQKRWRRGQRGRWHERRTLILSTHFPKNDETTEQAFDAVVEALEDPDTHIVFRLKLQRRLRRLENRLKIPIQDRHTCDGVLMDAHEVVFEATRLRHRAASLRLDRMARCIDEKASQPGNQNIKHYYSPVATVKPESNSSDVPTLRNKTSSDVPKGKSLWLGRNSEELTVEELALQRYRDQGFKGVHCETRVITMLFSLLFWDIIFESIPGAFETPYQTAPLDIAEDSFYLARKDLMEERLATIEAGKGVDFVREADAQNRPSKTWCVGVQWDLFSSEDLIDIVTCIGGKALSVICRVLCENYTSGTSGGPDLFLWDTERGTCKFVEVKGPGDSLQENQRVWIDILLKAPVAVEICRVMESGNETDKKPKVRTSKSSRKKTKKAAKKESVDADADALPTTFNAPDTTVSAGARLSAGPIDPRVATSSTIMITPSTHTEGSPSPLKRKASPSRVMSPTPSKRARSS